MDVFEIDVRIDDERCFWTVSHNGTEFVSGVEYTPTMALERAQHSIDLCVAMLECAA